MKLVDIGSTNVSLTTIYNDDFKPQGVLKAITQCDPMKCFGSSSEIWFTWCPVYVVCVKKVTMRSCNLRVLYFGCSFLHLGVQRAVCSSTFLIWPSGQIVSGDNFTFLFHLDFLKVGGLRNMNCSLYLLKTSTTLKTIGLCETSFKNYSTIVKGLCTRKIAVTSSSSILFDIGRKLPWIHTANVAHIVWMFRI